VQKKRVHLAEKKTCPREEKSFGKRLEKGGFKTTMKEVLHLSGSAFMKTTRIGKGLDQGDENTFSFPFDLFVGARKPQER